MGSDMLRLPTSLDFKRIGIAFLVFTLFAVPFGTLTGLFQFSVSSDPAVLVRTAIIALFIPALFEEAIFRGHLVWLSYQGSRKLLYVVVASLVLFVLWHPLNGLFLMTDAKALFTDLRFLTLVSALGVTASILAIKTCSIWPPVIFHWLVVVGWKTFFGGPAFL